MGQGRGRQKQWKTEALREKAGGENGMTQKEARNESEGWKQIATRKDGSVAG